MSILDLFTGNTADNIFSQIENKFGVSKTQLMTLLASAAPMVISQLKDKSQDAQQAEALNKALDKDHDGSILTNPALLANKQEEGNSILSHIFGNQKGNIENKLSTETGISMDKIGPILAMLAPIIMGYIGKQKQQNSTEAGGLSDLLGGILGKVQNQGEASGNPLNDIIGSVLGSGNGKDQKGGGIGDILGNLFGGK